MQHPVAAGSGVPLPADGLPARQGRLAVQQVKAALGQLPVLPVLTLRRLEVEGLPGKVQGEPLPGRLQADLGLLCVPLPEAL